MKISNNVVFCLPSCFSSSSLFFFSVFTAFLIFSNKVKICDLQSEMELDVEMEWPKMELVDGEVEMNGRRWSPSTGALREEMERLRDEGFGGGGKWRWSWTEMVRLEMEPVDSEVEGGDGEIERGRFFGGK